MCGFFLIDWWLDILISLCFRVKHSSVIKCTLISFSKGFCGYINSCIVEFNVWSSSSSPVICYNCSQNFTSKQTSLSSFAAICFILQGYANLASTQICDLNYVADSNFIKTYLSPFTGSLINQVERLKIPNLRSFSLFSYSFNLILSLC